VTDAKPGMSLPRIVMAGTLGWCKSSREGLESNRLEKGGLHLFRR